MWLIWKFLVRKVLEQLGKDHSNSVEIMTSGKLKYILWELLIKYHLPLEKPKRIE